VPIPAELDHYRILGPLGSGGMGDVLLAEDTRLHRRVAIKVLSETTATEPGSRQRLQREALAVAALNHPNIVTIHSVEEAGGVPYLVMELVEGRTLADVLQEGRLPLDRLLRIGAAVSDAIGAAQQRGITHRDLKPANVMITHEGRVKVLDFGLAKLRETAVPEDGETRLEASDITGEGRMLGTVAYMSPEQAEGKTIDSRSDIFSLGVMLHEMAAGERPFKGQTNVAVLSSILKDTPPSITDVRPELPAVLARIVRRCLSKDLSRRYQTAIDLRNDLEDLMERAETGADRVVPEPARPSQPAWRWPSLVVVLAGISVAAIALWWLQLPRGSDDGVFTVSSVVPLTSSGAARLAAISRDGRHVVHVNVEGTDGGLWLRQVATSSDVRIVPPTSAPYGGVTLSADGEFVYYTVTPGTTGLLYRVPALGGTPDLLVEGVDGAVSFSPDGKRMAFFRAQAPSDRVELMLANRDGSNVRSVANLPRGALSFPGPSWAPFGDTVLIGVGSEANTQFTPHTVDLRTGAATAVGGAWRAVNHLEWMPDGRSFLLAGLPINSPHSSPQVWQVSFPAGTLNRVTRDTSSYLMVRPTADGRTLAAVVADPRAAIWLMPLSDPAQRTRITRNDRIGSGAFGVAWTPDGGIAYSAMASEAFQIYRSSLDGSHIRQLTTNAYFKGYVDVARATNVLAYYEVREDRRAILRTYLDGPGTRELLASGKVTPPLVSPDGQWIYYADEASGQSTAYRVSSKGGTPEALGGAHFLPSDVSPDGKYLLGSTVDENRQPLFAVMSLADRTLRRLRPPNATAASLRIGPRFGPGGNSIFYAAGPSSEAPGLSQAGAGEALWELSRHGGTPRLVTAFDQELRAWSLAPDGKRVLVVLGNAGTDVVLLTRQ
jgi:serine/threonine protein kinase/Tol biopolymer transport system component